MTNWINIWHLKKHLIGPLNQVYAQVLLFKTLIWSDQYISCLKNMLRGTIGTDFNLGIRCREKKAHQ